MELEEGGITAAYEGFLSACREKDKVLFLFALIYVYVCVHIRVPRLDAFAYLSLQLASKSTLPPHFCLCVVSLVLEAVVLVLQTFNNG